MWSSLSKSIYPNRSAKIDVILTQLSYHSILSTSSISSFYHYPHMKLETPHFDGTEVMDWSLQISQYLEYT